MKKCSVNIPLYYVDSKRQYREESWKNFRNYSDDNTDVAVLLMNCKNQDEIAKIISDKGVTVYRSVLRDGCHPAFVARSILSKVSELKGYGFEYMIDDDFSITQKGLSSVFDYEALVQHEGQLVLVRNKPYASRGNIGPSDRNGRQSYLVKEEFFNSKGQLNNKSLYTQTGFLTSAGNVAESLKYSLDHLHNTNQSFPGFSHHDDSLTVYGSFFNNCGGVFFYHDPKIPEIFKGELVGTTVSSTLAEPISPDGILKYADDEVLCKYNSQIIEDLEFIAEATNLNQLVERWNG